MINMIILYLSGATMIDLDDFTDEEIQGILQDMKKLLGDKSQDNVIPFKKREEDE